MKKLFIIIFLFTLNCSTNKVSKNHGYRYLDNNYEKLTINKTNKNDVISIIGPPSSMSNFDENKWIYIERRQTNQSIIKLGIKKIEKNNVLIVEFNKMGILKNKKILDLNDMNKINYVKKNTKKEFEQDNYIYNVFSSLREKINAPARKRSRSN